MIGPSVNASVQNETVSLVLCAEARSCLTGFPTVLCNPYIDNEQFVRYVRKQIRGLRGDLPEDLTP